MKKLRPRVLKQLAYSGTDNKSGADLEFEPRLYSFQVIRLHPDLKQNNGLFLPIFFVEIKAVQFLVANSC